MSSRNRHLDEDERKRAPSLYGALREARALVEEGERTPAVVGNAAAGAMAAAGFDVEYAAVVDGRTLAPLERIAGTVLIAAAGRLGRTRLIDNIALAVTDDSAEEVVLDFPEWSRYEFTR
jgi:pantothenate synthetase